MILKEHRAGWQGKYYYRDNVSCTLTIILQQGTKWVATVIEAAPHTESLQKDQGRLTQLIFFFFLYNQIHTCFSLSEA
jgi:hypothetical protein